MLAVIIIFSKSVEGKEEDTDLEEANVLTIKYEKIPKKMLDSLGEVMFLK